jgi:hypothetical protein
MGAVVSESLFLSNLANPWILARVAFATLALAMALVSTLAAARILAIPADAAPDARALRAERDAELASVGLRFALVFAWAGASTTVLAAHRLASSVRGAMCAYGVLATSPLGARSLVASALSALAASAWLGMRSVDARIARGSLARTLARSAWIVTVLIAFDSVSAGAFFLGVDLRAHASCCSTGVVRGAALDPAARPWVSEAIGPVAASMALLAAGAAWRLARAPTVRSAMIASALAMMASASGAFALRDVVAPYAFQSPQHRCAYCLLRVEDAGWAGPLALIAWTLASAMSAYVLGIAWVGRKSAARRAAEATLVAVSRPWAILWLLAMGAGLWPALVFRAQAGTWALFGS